jgi:predicted ATP-dependent endonuclease of OLD family
MKIKNLSLQNFTAFEQAKFNFCDGINVLIGTNGMGKTHAMKAIYAVLNTTKSKISNLESLFNIHNSNILIRNNNGVNTTSIVDLSSNSMQEFYIRFHDSENQNDILNAEINISDYESVEPILKNLQEIITDSKSQEQDVVVKESEHFYFNLNGNKLDVNLVADGYRKLGTLFYLLRNGSLTTNSILFWDEPETNLNPKLIAKVAKVLQALADSGMQIFIATHDYLLSHELSLLAEYPSANPTTIKFFSLYNHENVMIEEGDSLVDISLPIKSTSNYKNN